MASKTKKPQIFQAVDGITRDPSYVNASEDQNEREVNFQMIVDRFSTHGEVTNALKAVGMTECSLIFGIDNTLSNAIQGSRTFGGKSLHDVSGEINPYQKVIGVLGETLETLDKDGLIPAYGFGDRVVKDKGIFPLKKEGPCVGFHEVQNAYKEITPTVRLGGPTNFAPLIREAIQVVRQTKEYHILVIVADGQVNNEDDTVKAIIEASNYPLFIVVIGVGDGPWEIMKDFDDRLPDRQFDNFQFVDYDKVVTGARNPDAALALAALMEIPDQYVYILQNKLLEK